MNQGKKSGLSGRAVVQWSLAPLVLIVIGLGWKWPLLGFAVPAVMLMGMAGGVFNGRYVCGNLCPRGAFFDRVMSSVSPGRPIPKLMRGAGLRWTLFVLLMGFMVWRLAQDGGNVYHWGSVFWLMCTVTTAAGLALAVFIHQRGWCSVCPVGTVQNALGGHKKQLEIQADVCRSCRLCEKTCPMALEIVKHREGGVVNERDCLRCGECVAKCPVNALSWPEKTA